MLQTIIGLAILAASMYLAIKAFNRKSTPTSPIGGGGTIEEGSTGTGDGSVTPPAGDDKRFK